MPIKIKRCAGACVALAMAVLCCCGRQSPDPTPDPEGDGFHIDWIRPADGDSLADSIRAEILVEGPTPERITLSMNDGIVAEQAHPPWRLTWLPSDDTAQQLHLLATAHRSSEQTANSPEIDVLWSPNRPPAVRFLDLPGVRAIDRSGADSLTAEAVDPEEGRLAGSAMTWISSMQGIVGCGDRIPLDALVLGRHRLRVRATDFWQRSGWAERELEIFEYQNGANPGGTLHDMRYALIAGDAEAYEESLAPAFRFLFCLTEWPDNPEVPSRWDRDDEVDFVRSLLRGNGTELISADWTVASVQQAIINEREWVKAELVAIGLAIAVDAGDTLSVVNGTARVYLSQSDRWRVEQWQDLGGEAGISQGRLRMALLRPLDKRYLAR